MVFINRIITPNPHRGKNSLDMIVKKLVTKEFHGRIQKRGRKEICLNFGGGYE